MTIVLMTVLGGLGAMCRFALDGWIRGLAKTLVPWATWVVNLLGSVVLGALTAGVVNGANPDLKVMLGTGFLGGFTTFSTASVETVRLLSGRHVWAGLLNAVGMALTCLAVAAGGYVLIR